MKRKITFSTRKPNLPSHSLIFGSQTGIEPVYGDYYIRRFTNDLPNGNAGTFDPKTRLKIY